MKKFKTFSATCTGDLDVESYTAESLSTLINSMINEKLETQNRLLAKDTFLNPKAYQETFFEYHRILQFIQSCKIGEDLPYSYMVGHIVCVS